MVPGSVSPTWLSAMTGKVVAPWASPSSTIDTRKRCSGRWYDTYTRQTQGGGGQDGAGEGMEVVARWMERARCDREVYGVADPPAGS